MSKYYDVLEKHPSFLNRFYKDGSSLTVTEMDGPAAQRTVSAQGDLKVRGRGTEGRCTPQADGDLEGSGCDRTSS